MIKRSIAHLGLLVFALLAGCVSTGTPPASDTPGEASPTPVAASPVPPTTNSKKIPLRVFCAGSLILPFAELEKAFESQNPQADVLNECHGSIQVIRHVTDLHEKIDVVATADYNLIPMLMYQKSDPDTGQPYARWYIRFATNRLSLAYAPYSRYADQVNSENWYAILAKPDVRVGIADPRFDASGYRALMALRLAEDYYREPDIFDSIIDDHFKIPITVFEDEDYTEIGVPEILEPKPDSPIIMRGASIQLIALLESGDLDYAFEYESVIRQHGLEWVSLPEAINLGSEGYDDTYGRVQVKLDFQRFASVKPLFKGEQIGYGITIPTNAPQPDLAAQFISFMLGTEGREIMKANFHPLLNTFHCDQVNQMPTELQHLCAESGQP